MSEKVIFILPIGNCGERTPVALARRSQQIDTVPPVGCHITVMESPPLQVDVVVEKVHYSLARNEYTCICPAMCRSGGAELAVEEFRKTGWEITPP